MKIKVLSGIIILTIVLTVFSCGKVIDYPEANKPLFNEGDSFVFKDIFSETFDTMIVSSINSHYEDHEVDLIEYLTITFVKSVEKDFYLCIDATPTGSSIGFLNISTFIGSNEKPLDSLLINGKQYINAFELKPKEEPASTDELVYLIYDQNYGLLKFKYFNGPEFVLDTVITSALK